MADRTQETGLAALSFARRVTAGLLEDIPDDQMMHQPAPGANHALWIMGHVATADEFFMKEVGKRPVKKLDALKALFFMGSAPNPDPSAYPKASEIRAYLDASREDLLAWFSSLPEAELYAALPEELQSFAASPAVLMSTIACHECLHAGQLTTIRKSLGLTPVFG
jgi:uncharacterized damage-inducible protein DinB